MGSRLLLHLRVMLDALGFVGVISSIYLAGWLAELTWGGP